jgi:hypothetical protein
MSGVSAGIPRELAIFIRGHFGLVANTQSFVYRIPKNLSLCNNPLLLLQGSGENISKTRS